MGLISFFHESMLHLLRPLSHLEDACNLDFKGTHSFLNLQTMNLIYASLLEKAETIQESYTARIWEETSNFPEFGSKENHRIFSLLLRTRITTEY